MLFSLRTVIIVLLLIASCTGTLFFYRNRESLENVEEATVATPVPVDVTSTIPQELGEIAPEDLLPSYTDADKFSEENPVTQALKEQNFLVNGFHYGISTTLQSNKIPYYDIRSIPTIPKEVVGPWNQSSYETTSGQLRKQFEIGSV